jgi:hypothetical protein
MKNFDDIEMHGMYVKIACCNLSFPKDLVLYKMKPARLPSFDLKGNVPIKWLQSIFQRPHFDSSHRQAVLTVG